MKQPFERRFLVNYVPEANLLPKESDFFSGSICRSGKKEVRLLQEGKKLFLEVESAASPGEENADSAGNTVRTALTRKQFETLKPLAGEARLEKKVLLAAHGKHKVTVNRYGAHLAGLETAGLCFADGEEMEAYLPAAWMGPEITGNGLFSDSGLAATSDGTLPEPVKAAAAGPGRSVGAIPVMELNGKEHVVLITTRTTGRWIFPKGTPEPDLGDRDLAAKECVEEAGVRGRLAVKPVQVYYWKGFSLTRIDYYPMLVDTLSTNWAESGERKRKVCTPEEAEKLLADPSFSQAMREAIQSLSFGSLK